MEAFPSTLISKNKAIFPLHESSLCSKGPACEELTDSQSPSSAVALNSLSSDSVTSPGISSSGPWDWRAVTVMVFSLQELDLPHFTLNNQPLCVERLQHPKAHGGEDEWMHTLDLFVLLLWWLIHLVSHCHILQLLLPFPLQTFPTE